MLTKKLKILLVFSLLVLVASGCAKKADTDTTTKRKSPRIRLRVRI